MSEMKPCPFLNDRVVLGESINANCEAPNKECCPKIRSTKKAVTRQCWRMTMLTPAEAAAKEAAKATQVKAPRAPKEKTAGKTTAKKIKKVENPPVELMGEATAPVAAPVTAPVIETVPATVISEPADIDYTQYDDHQE